MNNIISSLVLIFAIDNYTSDVSITYIYVCNAILENRGPHSYWFKQTATGTIIDTNSNGLVNLLHYEDAAAATVALTESTGILIRLTYIIYLHRTMHFNIPLCYFYLSFTIKINHLCIYNIIKHIPLYIYIYIFGRVLPEDLRGM